jgi:hypothetical protein
MARTLAQLGQWRNPGNDVVSDGEEVVHGEEIA